MSGCCPGRIVFILLNAKFIKKAGWTQSPQAWDYRLHFVLKACLFFSSDCCSFFGGAINLFFLALAYFLHFRPISIAFVFITRHLFKGYKQVCLISATERLPSGRSVPISKTKIRCLNNSGINFRWMIPRGRLIWLASSVWKRLQGRYF